MSGDLFDHVVEEGETYQIIRTDKAFDGFAIRCKKCDRTSYNHNDVKCRYCDNCKLFHDPLNAKK